MSVAPWLRMQASVFSDPKVRAAGPYASAVWLALLALAKASGSDGVIPAEALDGAYLAAYLGFPSETAEALRTAGNGLERSGLLVRDGAVFHIFEWDKYQGDPTARERKERFQAKQERRLADKERSGTVKNVRNGDVTGRDGTEESPPTPQNPGPEDFGFRKPSDLSPGTAQVLSLSRIDLRKRPGYTPEWERTVEAAAQTGKLDAAIAWLQDKGNLLKEPRDLRAALEPRGKFGGPPPETPEQFKATKNARRAAWIAEKVADLRRFAPEARVPWLADIESAKGPEVRAEIERALEGAA